MLFPRRATLLVVVAAAALPGVAIAGATSSPTFAADVAPILYEHCLPCHHSGGAAPFSLEKYEDARQRASLIARVTRSRYMPPWKPDAGTVAFAGERRLTDAQIQLLQEWSSAGAPAGDHSTLPPAPRRSPGWQLGTPDLVITLPAYTLGADGTDVFRNFVVPIPGSDTRFVRSVEFRPSSIALHHANIRLDRTRRSRALDEADSAPGYEGIILRSADYPDGHFLGWTPGQAPPLAPRGLAWRLEASSDFVVQLHMQPTGKAETVQPQIGLFFTDEAPSQLPLMLRLGRQTIDLGAGVRDYTSADSYTLPVDVELHALQPHSHSRATRVKAWADLPDGTTRDLLSISQWDFRWQNVYRLAAPMWLPAGTRLRTEYRFDNSATNPRNPVVPPRRVVWGFRSADEMADVWMQVMTRSASDRETLQRDFRQKAAAEDIAGGETQLAVDPSNAALHDDVAVLYLELGNPDAARRHFEAAARLRPQSAVAQYNVGTALEALQRYDEAAKRYRAALALDPAYARAHVNLGNMLLLDGHVTEAADHYRATLESDPRNVEAHNNLGRALGLQGQRTSAIGHLREALRLGPTASTHVNLAQLLLEEGQTDEAIASFRSAMALNPSWSVPPAGLSWIFSSHPDAAQRRPDEAIVLAERAVSLATGNEAMMLDALAAAYASAGRFADAVAKAEQAAALARRAGATALAAEIEKRLALYRRGRIYVPQ
jgi:prepilin-type processing-associated H-X9-DG protein